MMTRMGNSLVPRFRKWLAGHLNRKNEPEEFRTKEEYFRWKAEQQSQSAIPESAPPSKPPRARPAQADEIREGPAVCPYCGDAFSSFPKRKRKCPSCENVVIIWRGRDRAQRLLVTEARADALAADEEEDRARVKAEIEADPERQFRRVARVVDGFDVSEQDIRRRLSVSASEGDATWALLNQAANRHIAESDFQTLSQIYSTMALQLDRAGKDFNKLLREANRMKLLEIKQSDRESPGLFSGVQICSNSGCEACKRSSGKRFSLQEAIKLKPLPCAECTCTMKSDRPGFCTCFYLSQVSED
jgi:hypothetical protein